MSVYQLKDSNLFVASYGVVEVWELLDKDYLHRSMNTLAVWRKVRTVDPRRNEKLEVFGTIIDGQKLRQLAAELMKYDISANCEGNIFTNITSAVKVCFRLNDYFNWSKYGVTVPSITLVWNKCNLDTDKPVFNFQEMRDALKEYASQLEKSQTELNLCKRSLEEEKKGTADLEKRLEENEEGLSLCKQLLEEKEKGCANLEKRLEEKEKELSACKRRLEEKEKEKEKEPELQDCKSELNEKEREMSALVHRLERSLEVRDKELNDCRLQLKEKERQLSVMTRLWEKRLESTDCKGELEEMEKELILCKMGLEEKEQDCRRISDELLANKKKVTAVKIATRSLISYLRDLHQSLHEELGSDFPLPKFRYGTDQISLTSLEGGSNSTLISEAHIDIMEN